MPIKLQKVENHNRRGSDNVRKKKLSYFSYLNIHDSLFFLSFRNNATKKGGLFSKWP